MLVGVSADVRRHPSPPRVVSCEQGAALGGAGTVLHIHVERQRRKPSTVAFFPGKGSHSQHHFFVKAPPVTQVRGLASGMSLLISKTYLLHPPLVPLMTLRRRTRGSLCNRV